MYCRLSVLVGQEPKLKAALNPDIGNVDGRRRTGTFPGAGSALDKAAIDEMKIMFDAIEIGLHIFEGLPRF